MSEEGNEKKNEMRKLVDEAMRRIPMEEALREVEAARRDHELYGDMFVRVWPKKKGGE